MLAGIFASLAAYERELMHEPPVAAPAGPRGRHTGRPPRVIDAQVRQVRPNYVVSLSGRLAEWCLGVLS